MAADQQSHAAPIRFFYEDNYQARARIEEQKGNAALANGLALKARSHFLIADAIRREGERRV